MLRQTELHVLSAWCRARGMTWAPGRAVGRRVAVLLERAQGGPDAMLLVLGGQECRLLDIGGAELAAASDLAALLDAVDGGVADAGARPTRFAAAA